MIAEHKRNHGDFDGGGEIFNKIDNDNYSWFKGIIIEACKKNQAFDTSK